MKKYFDSLRACLLFRDIAPQELPKVLECLNVRVSSFDRGEAVLREGDPADDIGVVLTGRLQIVRTDFFGNRSILTSLGPGELFGESFACAGTEAVPVTVMAAEAAEVMLIDCFKITHACGNACGFHQQIIYNLLQIIAAKNLVFHERIEVTSKRTTREKLLTYLTLQAKRHGSLEFEIPYDRQELADYLEVERSGLSAEIGKLRRQGILEAERRKFKICRPLNPWDGNHPPAGPAGNGKAPRRH